MTITLDKFRAKLVLKILKADSEQETERFVYTAINAMQKRKVNGYLIIRFADKVFNQLSLYRELSVNVANYNNIESAIRTLQQIKVMLNRPAFALNKNIRQ